MGKGRYQTTEEVYEAARRHYVFSIKSDIYYFENRLKTGNDAFGETLSEERIIEINQTIKKLYAKLSDEKAIDHAGRSWIYGWKRPCRHQDNPNLYEPVKPDIFITTDSLSRNSKIRVPSLKRKNAWKRFYKNYPELKGVEVITGTTKSKGNQLNHSTIKLKKV